VADPIDKGPSSPKPDFIIARKTLRFLGRQLRTEQFALKGQVKKRKELERGEAESRRRIGRLKERIEKELDMNPGIFEGIMGEED
jgi:hypothetical protein